jgi:hypothetical protein
MGVTGGGVKGAGDAGAAAPESGAAWDLWDMNVGAPLAKIEVIS